MASEWTLSFMRPKYNLHKSNSKSTYWELVKWANFIQFIWYQINLIKKFRISLKIKNYISNRNLILRTITFNDFVNFIMLNCFKIVIAYLMNQQISKFLVFKLNNVGEGLNLFFGQWSPNFYISKFHLLFWHTHFFISIYI
jgi:hypothetical protein